MTTSKFSKSLKGVNFDFYSYFLLLEQYFHYNFEPKLTASCLARQFLGVKF